MGGRVAQALVTINSVHLGQWLVVLRPVRGKLVAPLVSIFGEKRAESEHTQATNILSDYASDDPDRLAELLMVSNAKAYLSLFPVAEKKTAQVLPIFQACSARQCRWMSSSRLPRLFASRDTALSDSAPMLTSRWCGSQQSGYEMDETGESHLV
jgi:hypothetical protein